MRSSATALGAMVGSSSNLFAVSLMLAAKERRQHSGAFSLMARSDIPAGYLTADFAPQDVANACFYDFGFVSDMPVIKKSDWHFLVNLPLMRVKFCPKPFPEAHGVSPNRNEVFANGASPRFHEGGGNSQGACHVL